MPKVHPAPWSGCAALALALAVVLPAAAADERPDLAQVRAAMADGHAHEAMIQLKGRLQQDPDDHSARALLARLYLDLGQGAAARQELERLSAAGAGEPAPADLRMQLGAALLLERQFDRVLKDSDPSVADPPGVRAELIAQRAEACLGLGDLAAAEPLLNEALALEADQHRALIGAARLALARGDTEAARGRLQQLRAAAPDAHEAWELLGELDYLQGDLASAERALTLAQGHSPTPWVALFKRAMVRIDKDDLTGADADIAAARAAGGAFPGLDLAAGALALRQGQGAVAATTLGRYVQAVPGDSQGRLLLGRALARLGRFNEAQEQVMSLRKLNPRDPDAVVLQARILLAQRQPAEAERVLRAFSEDAETAGTAAVGEVLYESLLGQGRTDEARTLMKTLTQRFPRQPRFALALADALAATGDLGGARAELERLRTRFPDLPEAALARARLELAAGDPQAALALVRALAEGQGRDPRVQVVLGQALAATGKPDRARQAFDQALILRPGFKPAVQALARLDAGAAPAGGAGDADGGEVDESRATPAVVKAGPLPSADPAEVLERLRQAVAEGPGDLRARLALARRLAHDQDPKAALEVLAQVPSNSARDPALLRLRGALELATGAPTQAVQSFAQLAAANPERPAPRYLSATAKAAAGDRAGMEEDLARGLRAAPDHPLAGPAVDAAFAGAVDDDARAALAERLAAIAPEQPRLAYQRGRLALRRGDPGAAAAQFALARKQVPDEARYQRALANALTAAGRPAEALADTRAWVSAHPDDLQARTRLAEALMRQGRNREAVGELSVALTGRPDAPMLHNNLAMALLKDDPKGALSHAEQAYAAAPRQAEVADTLGQALLATGDPKRAVEVLTAAFAASESDPGIGYHYARALVAAGDSAAAVRVLTTIVQRRFAEQEDARAMLAELKARGP